MKLKNGNQVRFNHSGDVDCSDHFEITANLTNSDILKLMKSPIETIRYAGADFYRDERDFDFPEFFINKIKCLD